MATVIQRPDPLSLLGNLRNFRISSSVPVVFKLQRSGSVLIEESYTPDTGGIVEIGLRGVIAQFLSSSLPVSDVHSQTSAHGTFSAYVDGTLTDTFTVVNCGVRKIAVTPENFLKANWLTWQPQTKSVRWHQPEYLTCYHVVASRVRARFYPLTGNPETVTVATASAGSCVSYNMQLSHLFSLSSHDADELNGVVDVWTETTTGTRLSYVQRYVFTPDTREEHYFLCANSLGGIDTFCFTGPQALAPSLAHEVAERTDAKLDVSANLTHSWSQNTGPFGRTEAKWMWEFFAASLRWAVVDDNVEAIVLDSSSVRASDGENVNACDFSFSLSEEGTLLKLTRQTGDLPNIEVPSPDGELFFLAPRVIDYPDANLSDALLFLVQSPYVQEWRKTDLGTLTEYITESIRLTAWGQLAHSHSNKDVIDLFSVDPESGKLLFDGEPVVSEGGDYETLSHLPTINNVVIRGDKLASDYGLVGPDMFELDTTSVPGKTLIHAKYDGLYSDGNIAAGGVPGGDEPGGSTVEWEQLVTTGTKIATITIDGITTDVYAPTGGGSSTLEGLTDTEIANKTNYDTLFFNNGKWRNIPFSQLANLTGLLKENSDARITGSWHFIPNNALEFTDVVGTTQIFGRTSGTTHDLYIYASNAIRLNADHVYVNGVEITGGGGTTVSWGSESNGTVPLTVGSTSKTLMLGSGVSWGSESGGGVPLTIKGTSKTLALKSALSSYLPLAGGTMTGSIIPNSTGVNLGSSAKPWGEIHANKWYPVAGDTRYYIEYTSGGFYVHGALVATGNVTAGL